MDLRVDWSPEAVEDVEAIADYISRDSEFYARSVVTKISTCTVRLGSFRHKLESNFALPHPSLNTPVEHHRIQSSQGVRARLRPTHTVMFLPSSSYQVIAALDRIARVRQVQVTA